jgi:hypothetical protein
MYFCFGEKNIFTNPLIFDSKIKLGNVKLCPLKWSSTLIFLLLFFIVVVVVCVSNNHNSVYVYGHSLFGSNNGSGIQTQTNGNFKVELSTNPPKIELNKTTDILLRVTSTTGEEIMELPVYLSLAKDGKNDNNLSQSLAMVRNGHYNFKSILPDQGKYLLFVNIKDIYYTQTTLNFIFELNVEVPATEQFYNILKTLFINYYYVYIPIALLISVVVVLKNHRKNRIQKYGVR